MRIPVKRFILPAVAVVVIGGAWWFAANRPVTVDVARVERGTIRSFVEEEGETSVVDRYVLSTPVEGRLLRVTRREGDEVKAGEVLATVDSLALKARVDEARARMRALEHQIAGVDRLRPKEDEIARSKLLEVKAAEQRDAAARALTQAKADFDHAKREADRARTLVADGTVTESEKEQEELVEARAREALTIAELSLKIRETELEIARLSTRILVESAKDVDWEEASYREQLRELQAGFAVLVDDLGRAKLTSPVDGVVLRRYQESEAMLAAGTPVIEVGDVGELEVHADLLSEDAARLTEGLPVDITGRALGDRTLTGTLKTIRPGAFTKISSLGVEQQRVTVVVAFDPAGTTLGDAYRVDVKVILDEKEDALLVPETALYRSAGKWRAFRIESGRARQVTVDTGLRDGRRREVLSGLAEGDVVILHPGDAIEDGTRVSGAGAD
jgi:HlyD family secretion protein